VSARSPVVGVLALQGAFREHVRLLRRLGADAREVRTPAELEACDALVLPGASRTTIGKLADSSGWPGRWPASTARSSAPAPA